jgi:hypothetical protein
VEKDQDDIQETLVNALGRNLRAAAADPKDLPSLPPTRVVDACVDAVMSLGKSRGFEVLPLRRNVGELITWGKNLSPDYRRLSATDPKDLFKLELVAEVSALGFRPEAPPERIVEEAALDLSKLVYSRAPVKALVFGTHRAKEPASSLDAMTTGLAQVIAARDRDGLYVLVAFPNLGPSGFEPGERWTIVSRAVRRGTLEPARERAVKSFF